MQAHNLIKEAKYTVAFKLINELVDEESLSDDDLIDLIWRIDNNLYLNTGYKESAIFLRNIREATFVQNRSEVISWIDREKERIKNWLGYKLGYAHSLVEEGNIDDAMKEYDDILSQIPHLENPDSLYLETQLMRAIDLCYQAKKYDEALLVSKEVHDVAIDKAPDNHLIICNSLLVIVESLIKLENHSEALLYCEENINLLKKHKLDEDGHHLLQALQQGCQGLFPLSYLRRQVL
jgi:tetratricopeptide (TPR) repeat protein